MRIPEDYLYYLAMHRECNERLLASAGDLKAADLELSLHPLEARLKKMVFAVTVELHRMKAFVRLQPLGTKVLYGFFKPRHRIGGHICDHFARRNSGIIVVLGNGSESWISLCRGHRIWRDQGRGLAESLERLRLALSCREDETNLEELWQFYYDSQYCQKRKNLAAFHRHMPRRDQEAAGLRLVQNKKYATLNEFLGEG